MIEYIYDAIKAEAGKIISIAAEITDETGASITEGCKLNLYDKDGSLLTSVDGAYESGVWNFSVPAALTKGFSGRYWYNVSCGSESLSFKQPLYF